MKKKSIIIATVLLSIATVTTSFTIITSFNNENSVEVNSKLENIDEVKIGKQIWMSKNLEVTTFSNGEVIEEAKNDKEWRKAGKEGRAAWCYFKFNSENGAIYGKMYNWFAVNDPRGLAPKGWHIPSQTEFTTLVDFLGGKSVAAAKMKSSSGWVEGANGNNSSGLNALPGGCQNDINGFFTNMLVTSYWWSSTEANKKKAFTCNLNKSEAYFSEIWKVAGLYVRCVKD